MRTLDHRFIVAVRVLPRISRICKAFYLLNETPDISLLIDHFCNILLITISSSFLDINRFFYFSETEYLNPYYCGNWTSRKLQFWLQFTSTTRNTISCRDFPSAIYVFKNLGTSCLLSNILIDYWSPFQLVYHGHIPKCYSFRNKANSYIIRIILVYL